MTDQKNGTEPPVVIVSVEEFTKLFGDRLNTEAMVKDMATRFLKYGGSYAPLEPEPETLDDYDRKAGDRVKYAPGDDFEDLSPYELLPGDVGTVIGVSVHGIIVRWDRIGRDVPVYNGELDDLGILEELADLASDKESYPMIKREN